MMFIAENVCGLLLLGYFITINWLDQLFAKLEVSFANKINLVHSVDALLKDELSTTKLLLLHILAHIDQVAFTQLGEKIKILEEQGLLFEQSILRLPLSLSIILFAQDSEMSIFNSLKFCLSPLIRQ